MANFCESKEWDDIHPVDDDGPSTAAQRGMALKIDDVLKNEFKVECLQTSPSAQQDDLWFSDLTSRGSFGANKYKPAAIPQNNSPHQQPNVYRLTGRERSSTCLAPFHAFHLWIYPSGNPTVVADYPHRGPLGALSKLIAFCEVGPLTEQRLVLIQETLDDAIEGGVVSYVSSVEEEKEQNHRIICGGESEQVQSVNDEMVHLLMSNNSKEKDIKMERD